MIIYFDVLHLFPNILSMSTNFTDTRHTSSIYIDTPHVYIYIYIYIYQNDRQNVSSQNIHIKRFDFQWIYKPLDMCVCVCVCVHACVCGRREYRGNILQVEFDTFILPRQVRYSDSFFSQPCI